MIKHLFVLASFLAAASAGSAQAPAQRTQDLRLSAEPRNMLVRAERSVRGKVTVKKGLREFTQGVDAVESARWIDQVGAAGDAVMNRRTVLEWHEKMNGLVKDPGLEGVAFIVSQDEENVLVALEGDPRASDRERNTQGLQAYAAGLWVELPEAAAVGSAFSFDGADLTATLTHMEEEILDFRGTMTLQRVDPKAQRAFLTGAATFKTIVEHRAFTVELSWKADYSAEVDLSARTLARCSAKGSVTPAGTGDFKGSVTGGMTFTAEAESQKVKDVAPHLKKKAAYRTSTRELFGIQVDLPSCWLAMPKESAGIQKYRDSRAGSPVIIEVANIAPGADPASDEFIEEFTKVVKDASPDGKVRKEKLPVGEGAVFELTADDGSSVKGCVVLIGDAVIRMRLVGSATAIKKAEADYQAAVASLRPSAF